MVRREAMTPHGPAVVFSMEPVLGPAAASPAANSLAELIRAENFPGAMEFLASLRHDLDAFFDAVTVNDARPEIRRNRLRLLARVRAAMHLAADFSRIEG